MAKNDKAASSNILIADDEANIRKTSM